MRSDAYVAMVARKRRARAPSPDLSALLDAPSSDLPGLLNDTSSETSRLNHLRTGPYVGPPPESYRLS